MAQRANVILTNENTDVVRLIEQNALDNKFSDVENRLREEIRMSESKLREEIRTSESRLREDIRASEQRADTRMDRLDTRMDRLELKVDKLSDRVDSLLKWMIGLVATIWLVIFGWLAVNIVPLLFSP